MTAFALHVQDVAWDWPERKQRKRAWFSVEVACKLVANNELSALIAEAVRAGAIARIDYATIASVGLAN